LAENFITWLKQDAYYMYQNLLVFKLLLIKQGCCHVLFQDCSLDIKK